MVLKTLLASIAAFVIVEGYLVFSPVIFGVDSFLDQNYGSVSYAGLTVGAFTARTFAMYGTAIVFCLIFLAVWYLHSSQVEEYDTGEMMFG